ncbi:hypothetical protein FHY02_004071 [Sphingomonas sp. BK069]|nr:hypothetical protein [Sphingomonas sp. BK069]
MAADRYPLAGANLDDVNMRSYASLIRELMPMDEDLDGLGAPVEAIRMVQSLRALCATDFEARYGIDFLSVISCADDEGSAGA